MSEQGARRELAGIVGTAADAAKPDAEQLDWLPPLRRALTEERSAEIVAGVRRRGRPPGAKNLATREALEFIRRVFGDPAVERSRWLLLAPDELASVLGCTTLEAFDRQDAIRADLARLFYAPLAPVDGQGNAVVPMFSMTIGGDRAAGGPELPPWMRAQPVEATAQETQQNQGDAASGPAVSHGSASHDEAK